MLKHNVLELAVGKFAINCCFNASIRKRLLYEFFVFNDSRTRRRRRRLYIGFVFLVLFSNSIHCLLPFLFYGIVSLILLLYNFILFYYSFPNTINKNNSLQFDTAIYLKASSLSITQSPRSTPCRLRPFQPLAVAQRMPASRAFFCGWMLILIRYPLLK